MKQLFLLLVIILLSGCEKDKCFECTVTSEGWGETFTDKYVVCGDMTKREAEQDFQPIHISSSKMPYTVNCKER